MTLRTKFILLSIVLVTIIMSTVTYFFTIREVEAQRSAVESQINRIARNIATMQLLDRQDWNVYQNYISQLMAFNEDIVYIAIYDDRNSLRAHTLNTDMIELERPVLSRRMRADIVRRLDAGGVAEDSRNDLRTQRVNIQVGDRVLGSVHLGFSVIDINRELQNNIGLNIVLGIIFILIFGGVSIIVSRRLTRPLERLSKAMEAVNEGKLDQKVEPETHDEIARLTQAFNDMIVGLRERHIIENLGYELSAAFQFDTLALLVRDRLSSAIGAAGSRMYIRKQDFSPLIHEITGAGSGEEDYPPIELTPVLKDYLLREKEGFMILNAPQLAVEGLQHKGKKEDGLVIPMIIKDELFGLLFFELPPDKHEYNRKQIHFAATLAAQAALALENALLYEKLREQERLKRELEIAHEVQQKLLPNNMPNIEGFQFDGICQSAYEVGGDYFDFFPLDDNHLGVVIADVSGKGTSASFYMAEIKGMMMHLTTRYFSPRELLVELNRKLYGSIDRTMFVTMVYGVMDIQRRTFSFARAGHNAVLKIGSNGKYQFLIPSGIGVGLDPGKLFDELLEERTVQLNGKDTLILYTDGLTEARNDRQEEFGEERLLRISMLQENGNVLKMREGILKTLQHFMNGAEQNDDITMVLLHCEKGVGEE